MKKTNAYSAPIVEILQLSSVLMDGYAQLQSTSSMPEQGMGGASSGAPKRREGTPAY